MDFHNPVTRPGQSSAFRTVAVLAGVVAILYFARDILIPLALAVTLTLILSPAVGWLQKMHIRRVPGTLLVMLLMVSAASGIGYVILNQLVQVVSDLPEYRENIHRQNRSGARTQQGRFRKSSAKRPGAGQGTLQSSGKPAAAGGSSAIWTNERSYESSPGAGGPTASRPNEFGLSARRHQTVPRATGEAGDCLGLHRLLIG